MSAAANLERPESGTVLRRGDDGFLYAVGDLGSTEIGSPFYARYSGVWPLEEQPRPPLATGHFLRKVADDAAVVSLDYKFPDTTLHGLVVTWQKPPLREEVGKGIAPVSKIAPSHDADLELSIGEHLGVQPGDIYAIVSPASTAETSEGLQLSKRIKAICLVNKVNESNAHCRLWRASSVVPQLAPVNAGDVGLFLEHTYGEKDTATGDHQRRETEFKRSTANRDHCDDDQLCSVNSKHQH